jgi:hypothetical protein
LLSKDKVFEVDMSITDLVPGLDFVMLLERDRLEELC